VNFLFQKKLKVSAFIVGISILAQTCAMPLVWAQHAYPATGHTSSTLPAVEFKLQKVAEKINSGFEAYDNTPLGSRMPLVLVHGIGGTESRLFHWENFLQYTDTKPEFKAKYKIYLYHYDSTRSVPAISADLQKTLKRFVGSLNSQESAGQRKIKILAYSEGGLLIRNALQDTYLDEHTEEVLAIATPFHGSPLANPEWMAEQVKSESAFSLVRLGQKLAYKITRRKYPTFKQDFHWDNFDGAIPMEQYVKNNGPIVQQEYALAKKRNFVTYGSYFGTEVDATVLSQELGLTEPIPKERPMVGNLFRKNFLFSLVRNNIGRLPLAGKLAHPSSLNKDAVLAGGAESVENQAAANLEDAGAGVAMLAVEKAPAEETATNASISPELVGEVKLSVVPAVVSLPGATEKILKHQAAPLLSVSKDKYLEKPDVQPVSMMMFNDGISPISSTLWLGRYTYNNGVSVPVDRLWNALKSLKGSRQARLFAGLDHRNWMDGMTRTGEEQVQDLLNPDEPPRTVFEWILHDLMS
jgi:triacylglycerol esterase/lipase EstA (alpha/beta hydrolase family)